MKEVIVELVLEIWVGFRGIPGRRNGARKDIMEAVYEIHWIEKWELMRIWIMILTVGHGENELKVNYESRVTG